MSTFVRSVVAAAAAMVLVPTVSATVLTFDDLPGTFGAVPSNYGGLDWSGGAWFYFGAVQDPYTPHSDPNRAFVNPAAADAATAIGFASPTSFQGAWIAGNGTGDLNGHPVTVTVAFQLYLAGSLVHTSATLIPSNVPTFLDSGYAGMVDEVIVSSPFQGFYAMDDFTFGQPVTQVPEPATYGFMLLGLGVVGWVARRRGTR